MSLMWIHVKYYLCYINALTFILITIHYNGYVLKNGVREIPLNDLVSNIEYF